MDRHNTTKCTACVVAHAADLTKCTSAEKTAFCAHKPGPNTKCEVTLVAKCKADKHNATLCRKCVEAHNATLKEAGCTEAEEHAYCEAKPKPPTPKPPAAKCAGKLEAECSTDRHNATLCRKCVAANAAVLKAAGCTTEEEERYCTKPPVPPTPEHKCEAKLKAECGTVHHDVSLCGKCIIYHAAELTKAGCTSSAISAYCKHTPPKPPSPPPSPPKVITSCCTLRPRTTPFPGGKFHTMG